MHIRDCREIGVQKVFRLEPLQTSFALAGYTFDPLCAFCSPGSSRRKDDRLDAQTPARPARIDPELRRSVNLQSRSYRSSPALAKNGNSAVKGLHLSVMSQRHSRRLLGG